MFLVLKTSEKTGFAQSVDLHQLEIRHKLADAADEFRRIGEPP